MTTPGEGTPRVRMDWVAPAFSRSQVDRAGRRLRLNDTSPANEEAREILANWRAAHAFPLNTMQVNLRQRARRVDSDALIAQRLKRETSIVRKLGRSGQMRLTQMQDIGGCRAVLKSADEVDELFEIYRDHPGNHQTVSEKNYVVDPPASGYRGVHIVQRYHSAQKAEFSGLLVEIQIRSLLQHAWATAVETVDAFLATDLKSSLGPPAWQALFSLVGSAFANLEGRPPVPGTPEDNQALYARIAQGVAEIALLDHLEDWSETVRQVTGPDFRAKKYLLLDMRPDEGITRITTFPQRDFELASEEYSRIEAEVANLPRAQAVLVSADSIRELKRSYPSYFADSTLFLAEVRKILARFDRGSA